MRRRESPIKRRNPSGEVVCVARYTGHDGKRHIAKPSWNGGKGTFGRKHEAQRAIDEAYGLSDRPDAVGDYLVIWTDRHPRSERTNATNEHRIGRVLDVEIEGIALRDWPIRELRRRHALALVDHMLTVQHRATTGAVGILRSLSAMAEDAITDEVADVNPFKGVRIRANDPRAKTKPRPIQVFSFEEMHRFAKSAGTYEPMVRVFTDCGLRLGEVLPLRREDFDGESLQVRRTAHEGTILEGTKTDHGEQEAGRVVPVPATLAWMLEAQINLNDPDCDLLFTTPTRRMWRERNFYRDIWKPTQQASGLDIRPHECRTPTSPTSAPRASTTPTWPRSLATASRRCLRDTRTQWGRALGRCVLPLVSASSAFLGTLGICRQGSTRGSPESPEVFSCSA
jgi:integrase